MDNSVWSNTEAYDRWAQTYPPLPHNPLMRAEQRAMLAMLPSPRGAQVLDLACGTGRYGLLLEDLGAASVVGVDLSQEMLRAAPLARRVRADMSCLPFADARFDLVVSGLAVGHAPSLAPWMAEVARVLAPGGHLVYSDFHPDAARAGMTRSFTDAEQRRHTLAHRLYDAQAHEAAANSAGLEVQQGHVVRVGHELQEAFKGSDDFYRRWHGLALVLVLRLGRVRR